MHFEEVDETVTLYIGPPPQPVTPSPQGPIGALPLGHHGDHIYHMTNFESSSPKDDSCL